MWPGGENHLNKQPMLRKKRKKKQQKQRNHPLFIIPHARVVLGGQVLLLLFYRLALLRLCWLHSGLQLFFYREAFTPLSPAASLVESQTSTDLAWS